MTVDGCGHHPQSPRRVAMHIAHGSRSSAVLDLARILAAVAVFVGHMRNVWFVGYAELENGDGMGDAAVSAFYALTGFGHQAVIVFFVLSGFFIGQAVRSRHEPGSTWSWGGYLIDRLSRLHIVLLPALLLTLAADLVGSGLMPELYAGDYPGGLMAPGLESRLGPDAFVLNSLYLQTIAVPAYGSNAPLWSLAYEFWFYLVFPTLVRAFLSTRNIERVASVGLLIALGLIAGEDIVLSFPIWLLGAAIAYVKPTERFARVRRCFPWVTVGLLVLVLAATRVGGWPGQDYALGVACALWVLAVVASPGSDEAPRHRSWRLATKAAAFSYTLYAFHLPLVFLVRAALGESFAEGQRSQIETSAVAIYIAVTIGILAASWGFGQLTEARTPGLRRWLRRLFRIATERPA